MAQRLFITSSGTEIGKTFITAALIHQLREAGHRVAAYKPILSGFTQNAPQKTDTGVLLTALEREITTENIAAMTPWRFAAALSPDMAAAREGRDIEFAAVKQFTAEAFAGPEDVILMEGVGGVMAPIGPGHTVLDWIKAANVPALLVVGGYLGTISHTLTAAHAIKGAGLSLAGIVISARGELPVPAIETVEAISRFLPGIPIAICPDCGEANEVWRQAPDLLGSLLIPHTPA